MTYKCPYCHSENFACARYRGAYIVCDLQSFVLFNTTDMEIMHNYEIRSHDFEYFKGLLLAQKHAANKELIA